MSGLPIMICPLFGAEIFHAAGDFYGIAIGAGSSNRLVHICSKPQVRGIAWSEATLYAFRGGAVDRANPAEWPAADVRPRSWLVKTKV
jgi:hypothetical protein